MEFLSFIFRTSVVLPIKKSKIESQKLSKTNYERFHYNNKEMYFNENMKRRMILTSQL